MYLDHFNLREHPFRMTPDPRFLYLSRAHARALAYLDYAVINRDSFVLITGEIGSGKTTLIQRLFQSLDENVILARIHHTRLTEREFLEAVLVELGLDPFRRSKVEVLDMLNSFLLEHYARGERVLLVVDEAQNLSAEVLEEVRLLSGLETRDEKLLNVILVGQPELKPVLASPGMQQLAQRIRFQFHLTALSEEECGGYIRHRLAVAGGDPDDILDPDAVPEIHRHAKGIPRLINTLCDTAMVCAYADGGFRIAAADVHTALQELQWDGEQSHTDGPPTEWSEPPGDRSGDKRELEALYSEIHEELARMEARINKLTNDLGD